MSEARQTIRRDVERMRTEHREMLDALGVIARLPVTASAVEAVEIARAALARIAPAPDEPPRS